MPHCTNSYLSLEICLHVNSFLVEYGQVSYPFQTGNTVACGEHQLQAAGLALNLN